MMSNAGGGAIPVQCPGGVVSMAARALDPAGWADVRMWLEDEENVTRLLAEWEQKQRSAENSVASRVTAVDATIRTLRQKMDSLAETIAETTNKESRRTLQDKLDSYSEQVTAEERKREKLLAEARDAAQYAQDARDVRQWLGVVRERAEGATREEQRTTLLALGAQVTIWRNDHVHQDGWPQRYRIVLNFTGFGGQPVTLPAGGDENLTQTTCRLSRRERRSPASARLSGRAARTAPRR